MPQTQCRFIKYLNYYFINNKHQNHSFRPTQTKLLHVALSCRILIGCFAAMQELEMKNLDEAEAWVLVNEQVIHFLQAPCL